MATQNSTTKVLDSINNDVSLLVMTISLLRFAVNKEDTTTINSIDAYLYELEQLALRVMEELGDVDIKKLEVTQ